MQDEVPLIPGEKEHDYYPRLCNAVMRPSGFDCAFYGEELAVAKKSGSSENFDLILANGNPRPAFYASTCLPATRSEAIAGATPTPSPTPGPTPTPTPTPSPGSCTFSHADFLRDGRWQSLKVTAGAGERINADATAVGCDRAKCTAAGFSNRDCCPNYPEGHPDGPSCNVEMARPKWRVTGGRFCAQGSEDGLVDNPLRNCMVGSGKITVCSGLTSKCIEAAFP